MKISKALGFGLLLHVLLIAMLVVQPSCRTMEAPTQTYQQSKTLDPMGPSPSNGLISDDRTDSLLDPAFNMGLTGSSNDRFDPTRPGGSEFSEFEEITPKLSPIPPAPTPSTVDIAGPSLKIHTVRKGESLWAISRRYNVSVDDLYSMNGLNKSSILKIGQQIKIPVEGSTGTIKTITPDAYQPTGFNMDAETYTVVRGDTLSKIARRFNTTVSMIKTANNKKSDAIRVGEKLTVPINSKNSDNSGSAFSASSSATKSSFSANSSTHIVKSGEYPGTIARKYGMTASELLAINGITDPRSIQVGQRLKVNSESSTTPASSSGVKSTSAVNLTAPKVIQPQSKSSTSTSTPKNTPVEIRVVEADPLVESELGKIDTDSIFDNVEEIPVVPLDD